MAEYRQSPPLPEPVRPRSMSPPGVKLERKKPQPLLLSPQRDPVSTPSPVLTPLGPGTEELETIWEPQSSLSLAASEQELTPLSPHHLEQILERLLDQKERLQDQLTEREDSLRDSQLDLSVCARERELLIAQLSQLTPQLSAGQLEELEGIRTCPESDLQEICPLARRFWDEFLRLRGDLEGQRDIVSDRDEEVRSLLAERGNTRILLEHLERLVARHERSLRSTVVKRQTAQNGVSSEVEVLKALKCLFDHHKTLDRVKDKLKLQVARNKELEDQLTDSLTQRELSQLAPRARDSLGQLLEREREIEALRFELEELRAVSESHLEQTGQQLEDSREQCRIEGERREEAGRKLKDIYSLLTNKERAISRLEKQLSKCQLALTDLTQEANQKCLEMQRQISDRDQLLASANQLLEPTNQLLDPTNQLRAPANQLLATGNQLLLPTNQLLEPANQLLDPTNQLLDPTNQLLDPTNQLLEPTNQLLDPVNQLLGPTNQLLDPVNQLLGPTNQLLDPVNQLSPGEEQARLLARMESQELELLELREQLSERTRSEEQMHTKVQQTVGKLSQVQREKMDLEQLLHESLPNGADKRGSRRSKKMQRQSMHAMISEINRMSDPNLIVHSSLPVRELGRPGEFPRMRARVCSPEHTPSSSRKGSPEPGSKQSPTESDLGLGPLRAPLHGSHSSLSDIDTLTTISDTSHIVDESVNERTEFDPGAPKLSIPRSRKKSLKRKSSLRRIVHSFRGARVPVPRELPAPVLLPEEPDRRSRLEAAIACVERRSTQFLLWSPEELQAWVEVELGLPEPVGEAVRWQCRTVPLLLSMGDRDYEQELGIQEPLLRLKLLKAVQERVALSRAGTPCLYSPYRGVSHEWIAACWLPSLGLTQYNNNFRQCCVDGRVLEHLSKKELRTSLGMVESSHRNSLQFGILALRSLNYDRHSLEEKQRQLVTDRTDMPFWSNAQIGQWLRSIGLGTYTCNLEFSGLHGAVLYFDSSYDYHEIAITLQIPQNDSVSRKRLKASLSDLLSLPRSGERKSRRRSFALFRRRSDAASLGSPLSPRASPEPAQTPDLAPSPCSDEDRTNPVQYYC